jgi:hypothetical protein
MDSADRQLRYRDGYAYVCDVRRISARCGMQARCVFGSIGDPIRDLLCPHGNSWIDLHRSARWQIGRRERNRAEQKWQ